MKRLIIAAALLSLSPVSWSMPQQPGNHNGEIQQHNGELFAWNDAKQYWQEPTLFWLDYANSRGGLSWGHSTEYPPYEQVNELETFLVKVDSGDCLMQFFHNRWRRANDVRRWDPAFNEYSGCADVFK